MCTGFFNVLRATFFMPAQSSVMSRQMQDFTCLSLDHIQGEQLLLAHSRLVMVLGVVKTMLQPQIPLAWDQCIFTLALVLYPYFLPQPNSGLAKQVLEPSPSNPIHHLLVVLLSQPISVEFSLIVHHFILNAPISSFLHYVSSWALVLLSTSFLSPIISSQPLLAFSSPSFFELLSCHVVTSLHLFPKLPSQQVDLLWTCSYFQILPSWQCSSFLCPTSVFCSILMLLLLPVVLFPAVLLSILQPCYLFHWGGVIEIPPRIFLWPMTCLMDPWEVDLHTMVLSYAVWIIWIENLNAKPEFSQFLDFYIYIFQGTYLVQPNPQRRSTRSCPLPPV